jgi:HEAT repeat protein
MRIILIWIVVAAAGRQDPCDLVQALRSESVEERDAAELSLKSMGKAAVPELEKAAKSGDLEVAQRAKRLLRVIAAMEMLNPRIMKAVPGIEERLAEKEGYTAARAFSEVEEAYGQRRRSGLRREDLETVGRIAFRRREKEDVSEVCRRVGELKLRGLLPEIVELLKGENSRARRRADSALDSLDGPEGLAAVRSLLREERWELRVLALQTLGLWRRPETIPDVAARLDDPSDDVRTAAIGALGRMRAVEHLPALARSLKDPSSCVRGQGAISLAVLGSGESNPAIAALLKDEDDGVRKSALVALARLKAPQAVPAILARAAVAKADEYSELESLIKQACTRENVPAMVKLVEGDSSWLRRIALDVLGEIGGPAEVPVVARRLGEMNEEWVRAAAVSALRRMKARDRADEVAALLSDDSPALRAKAVEALAELGGPSIVPALVKRLKDENEDVQEEAISALALLGAKQAVPEIAVLLQGGSPSLRGSAARALGRLGSREHAADLVPLLREKRGVRESAQCGLLDLHAKETIPALVKLLEDESVCSTALEVLASLKARESIPSILPLLRSREDDIRGTAVQALSEFGDPALAPSILPLLEDESGWVRSMAVEALGRIAPCEVVSRMGDLFGDGHRLVRLRTLEVLVRDPDAAMAPILVEAMDDPEEGVCELAARALCVLGRREPVPSLIRWGGRNLLYLNASRSPGIWKKLREGLLEGDWKGTPAQGFEFVAKALGLPVVLSPGTMLPDYALTLRKEGRPLRLIDVLERCITWESQVVLDSDRLWILGEGDAWSFWSAWGKIIQPKP